MVNQSKGKPIPDANDPFWTAPTPRSLYVTPQGGIEHESQPSTPWEAVGTAAILTAVGLVWVVGYARGR